MSFVFWLVNLVVSILGCVLILRAYLWSLGISPRDPMVRFAWKLTDWLVNPISYIIRPRGNWEWASFVSALLVAVVATLLAHEVTGFPATGLAFAIAPIALVLRWATDLMTWGLIFYCVMSFVANPFSPYYALLATLMEPFLRPLRRFIPNIGRLDLTPIVLFIVLSALQGFLIVPASTGLLVL